MRPIHIIILSISAFLILIAVRLVQDGMFIDGLWYATMANNLALGDGTLWDLHFTPVLAAHFVDHPPLGVGMMAVFFTWLGSGMEVERIFCAALIVATAAAVAWIWRISAPSAAKIWWPAPIAVWLLNEETGLRYSSNLLDGPMALLDLSAVGALVLALKTRGVSRWILTGAGGLLTGMAFLTKGPAGLFPWAFFGVWYLTMGGLTWKKTVLYTMILLSTSGLFLAWFWLNPPSAGMLHAWWEKQVVAALTGKSEQNIAPWRFYMVQRFIEVHAHWMILSALAIWRVYPRLTPERKRAALQYASFFGLIGASALLPVTVSGKQAAHYIVPSLPWFALAFGVLLWPVAERWSIKSRPWLTPFLIALNLVGVAVVALNWGKTLPPARRWLPDMRLMSAHIPPHSTVAYRSVESDFQMHGYFQRYHYTALDFHGLDYPFLILEKGMDMPPEAEGKFEKVELATKNYDLYKKM